MRNYIYLFVIFLFSGNLIAQSEFSLYNLNQSVGQANKLNPAFHSNQEVILGFPALSSMHFQMNTGAFSFDNIFSENTNGAYDVDWDKLSGNLKDQNYFSFNADVQLFALALNFKKNHFSFAINEKASAVFSITDDIANLLIYGNGDAKILGEKISFNNMVSNQMAYHEIALGYAREISDKLTVGLTMKYLAGIGFAKVKGLNGYALTSNDSVYFEHNGFSVLSADGFDFEGDKSYFNSFSSNSKGFALDLGAQYKINDEMKISAAITDLGSIKWKGNTKEYQFDPVNYSFSGFEIEKLINNNASSDETFNNETDSLETLMDPIELAGLTYKTKLSANVYLGFNYEFHPSHHIGTNIHAAMLPKNVRTAFSVYYNYKAKKNFDALVNMSVREGSGVGLGLGTSVELGSLQLYMVTESLNSLFKPSKAHILDARFGINFVFGKHFDETNNSRNTQLQ